MNTVGVVMRLKAPECEAASVSLCSCRSWGVWDLRKARRLSWLQKHTRVQHRKASINLATMNFKDYFGLFNFKQTTNRHLKDSLKQARFRAHRTWKTHTHMHTCTEGHTFPCANAHTYSNPPQITGPSHRILHQPELQLETSKQIVLRQVLAAGKDIKQEQRGGQGWRWTGGSLCVAPRNRMIMSWLLSACQPALCSLLEAFFF